MPVSSPHSLRYTSAAFHARLSSPPGISMPLELISIPPPPVIVTVTSSKRSTGCMSDLISWYPSGLLPNTSSVRLTFAGERRVIELMGFDRVRM